MILAGMVVAGIAVVWLGFAVWLARGQKITFAQALLFAPLAALWRVDAGILQRIDHSGPLVYVVSHQSKIDPALMLSLLPADTLHILDDYTARAGWLEPWRSLARTMAFNPEHVFVSRRLVTVLRRGGRLCVYMPADAVPGSKPFRLYRAVARIALRGEARVIPVHVAGADELPFPVAARKGKSGRLFPKLTVRALEPATMQDLISRSPAEPGTSSAALYGRMEETRRGSAGNDQSPELGQAA